MRAWLERDVRLPQAVEVLMEGIEGSDSPEPLATESQLEAEYRAKIIWPLALDLYARWLERSPGIFKAGQTRTQHPRVRGCRSTQSLPSTTTGTPASTYS